MFVSQQLGHSSLDTTKIYAKTLNDKQLEQMEGFFKLFDETPVSEY